jgi:hypothetical protein
MELFKTEDMFLTPSCSGSTVPKWSREVPLFLRDFPSPSPSNNHKFACAS